MLQKILVVVCLVACVSQAQILRFNITCAFENSEILGNERYTCSMDQLEYDFSTPFYFIQVTGNHLSGRTNDDVQNLRLTRSETNLIPSNIFNVFPNVQALEVENCGGINFIPPDFLFAGNLQDIRIVNNNISTLGGFAFIHTGPTLQTLILDNNNMTSLGPMPFANSFNLRHVSIANNRIRVLTPRMTSTLRNLRTFDASNNQIEDLDGRIFFNSRLVERVNFSGNNILSIGSSMLNINANIRELQLEGNQCINQNFEFESEVDLEAIRAALNTCFINSPLGTQLTLTVDGNLIVFDENDEVVLRIE
jgi:Leucine-rich repeat (LRR) protein